MMVVAEGRRKAAGDKFGAKPGELGRSVFVDRARSKDASCSSAHP
jgi:hypothetical protein